jgi:hexulose-6-phosphate isomerase
VHVKDRLLGGGTVALGSGQADFPTCFHLIRSAGFKGPFVLQAARDENISEVELARKNKQFIEKHLEALKSDV